MMVECLYSILFIELRQLVVMLILKLESKGLVLLSFDHVNHVVTCC